MGYLKSFMKSGHADYVQVEVELDGKTMKKNISFNDYLKLLTSSCEDSGVLEIGRLPDGFYNGKLSIMSKNSFSVIITVEQAKREMRYFSETIEVPFPTLVFYFDVKEGRCITSKVFACKDKDISDDTTLYYYPYGNVYKDGRICWGDMSLSSLKIESMKDMNHYVRCFFEAGTNNDLFRSEHFSNQRDLLDSVVGLDVFPADYLSTSGMKIGHLL